MNRRKFLIALLVLTMSGPALGIAQSTQTTSSDYFGHAAVGVWMEGSSGPYGFMIVHAVGTVQ
ncbi:MAG: hypothetical protein AB7V46_12040, partial [Thermomicrobiales bacterium]